MKPSTKGKDQQKQPDKKGKNKNEPEEEEEPQGPPPEKPLNLERFIYVTTYLDSNFISNLKQLFEEINQEAFNLKSVKEIYTKGLTEEERDNNEIDYISGFQLIDRNIRITILEGITGKAMKKIKEKLPKTQMNTKNYMVFADSNVLFNKRLYSKFDLSLKYIKLRDTLSNILQTFDIYTKANKYRQIYDAFLNFGSILKAQTLREISEANLFPDAESLLLLERKYADILNDEDMTGIHKEKKKRRRIKLDTLTKTSTSGFSGGSNSNKKTTKRSESLNDSGIPSSEDKSKKIEENEKNNVEKNDKAEIEVKNSGPLIDARNPEYENFLKQKQLKRFKSHDIWKRNFEDLHNMKRKPHENRFCMFTPMATSSHKLILFGPSKINHYEEITKNMREKYLNDTKHFYTYSLYGLTLNFPMIERDRNEEYIKYIENKRKWHIKDTDFDRYKQPPREKYYFPKINNIL